LLQTGFDPFSLFDGQIKKYSELGYLEVSADRLALTPEGRFLFNEIVPDFLGE
jgi:coproporphyrinogen III oxidase-like Fe-S oxidoreductase